MKMDEIKQVFLTLGVTFDETEIEVLLQSNTVNQILKMKLKDTIFYFSTKNCMLGVTNQGLYEQYDLNLTLNAYDCYRLFGIEKLNVCIEKNVTFVE